MKANYKVTGNDRKALVAAIENLTGNKAIYMRMPTCAYEIGDITVDKEGGVTCDDTDKLERLVHNLIADGFTPEDTEEDESENEEAPTESNDEFTGLTVSLPLDKVAVGNLTNLLTAKEHHSALTTLKLRCQRIRSASLGSQRCRIQKRSKPTPTSLLPLAK